MAASLGVAAGEADGGALPAGHREAAGLGGGVGFEALDSGGHFNGGTGVGGAFVVGERDGFEVVGPDCEGVGAGRFSIVAGFWDLIRMGEVIQLVDGVGRGECYLLVAGVADDKPNVVFCGEGNPFGYI